MNYKDTLNLPRTDFPMKADLVKREPLMLERWERENLYAKIQERTKNAAKTFVLHDGPPFANGDVHMGTALNKILKDFIVKSKSMMGFHAPYVPGWDCHGLPIEYKVVKNHAGLSPVQVRQKCEEFARKYIDVQRRQFKRLGVLGDWEKPYLTLDKKYEADVLRVFGRMVERNLVYRSKKPVYWSTGAQTALAEAEVEYVEKSSPSIFVKFEVTGMSPGTSVVIWTTTPWTLPANLAVAVHPKLRYAKFKLGHETLILCAEMPAATYEKLGVQQVVGEPIAVSDMLNWKLKHPFLDREVPVLAADFVASDTGTGCVHIAPGHGQDDYKLAKHLGLLSPVDDEGRLTAECGVSALVGQYVFDANKDVVALLRTKGRLVAEETIQHSYPHCWRSKTPIIFRAVEQWFIRVEDLKAEALTAIESVHWVPSWGKNRIRATVESRSDWCISRQRAWGVPLPIFYKTDGEAVLSRKLSDQVADLVEKHGATIWFELSGDALAKELGLPSDLSKRNDTLDVWIDSGSSHEAVLKRHPELQFPAHVYLEGSDQHRGWFQSSLLTSVAVNQGKAPYREVITNGFLVDLDGKKISKSSAYEKPKDAETFVNKYGADIVRLWVASENYQNDVPLSEEIFTRIGDTYRSIRNTLRILLANLYDFDPTRDKVELSDKEAEKDVALTLDAGLRSLLNTTILEVLEAYDRYEFHKVYHSINRFCAVHLSAFYVDVAKDRLYCDKPDSIRRRATQTAMHDMAGVLIRLLAPILSFTADEAWGILFPQMGGVHLQGMPPSPVRDPNFPTGPWSRAENDLGALMHYRDQILPKLEESRQNKRIGKSIEACVKLRIGKELDRDFKFLGKYETLLPELFIVSQVELERADIDGFEVLIKEPRGKKCDRCWRWDETVGKDIQDQGLCARCADAVNAYHQKMPKK